MLSVGDRLMQKRLDDIEYRLGRIEAALGLAVAPPVEPAPPKPLPVPVEPIELEPEPIPVQPVPAVPPRVEFPFGEMPYTPPKWVQPPAPKPARGLEQTIGLKWAGWVGAIVFVIGAGIFVQYLYERGLFAIVTPAVRVALLASAGLILLTVGELVYRRVNPISATGLFGAGIAVLFLTAYAGFGFYGLYPPGVAFALMAVTTVLGSAVAWRHELVSIATVSILGGSLAPALLRAQTPNLPGLFVYLLFLQAVALSLAYIGSAPRWWTLRGLSLLIIAGWVGSVLTGGIPYNPLLVVGFVCVAGLLFQVELILSIPRSTDLRSAPPFSLLVTAAVTAATLYLLRNDTQTFRTGWTLTLAVVAGITARACRRQTNLSTSFFVQTVGLVVIAVPVAMSGFAIPVGWAALAVGLSVLASRSAVSPQAAPAVWMLSVGAWLFFTTREAPTVIRSDAISIGRDTVIAWGLAVAGHAVAAVTRRIPAGKQLVTRLAFVVTVSAGLLAVAATVAGFSPLSATAAVAVYLLLLAAFDRLDPDPGQAGVMTAGLIFAAGKWVFTDLFLTPARASAVPILTSPALGVGLLLTLAVAAVYWRVARVVRASHLLTLRSLAVLGVIGLPTIGVASELLRVLPSDFPAGLLGVGPTQLVQLLWTALAAGAIVFYVVVGFRVGIAGSELHAAMPALAVLPAAKFILFDTTLLGVFSSPGSATAGVNPRSFAAAVVLTALVTLLVLRGWQGGRLKGNRRAAVFASAVAVLWWAGTLEVWQAFHTGSGGLLEQVAVSVFWAVFALAAIVAGFRWSTAGLRRFGLTLFAVTLLKVIAVDLSDVSKGYRVLSFLALGLLLMAVSVVYGKLTPRLATEER